MLLGAHTPNHRSSLGGLSFQSPPTHTLPACLATPFCFCLLYEHQLLMLCTLHPGGKWASMASGGLHQSPAEGQHLGLEICSSLGPR